MTKQKTKEEWEKERQEVERRVDEKMEALKNRIELVTVNTIYIRLDNGLFLIRLYDKHIRICTQFDQSETELISITDQVADIRPKGLVTIEDGTFLPHDK